MTITKTLSTYESEFNNVLGDSPSTLLEAGLGAISAGTKALGTAVLGNAVDDLSFLGTVGLDPALAADGLLNAGYYLNDMLNGQSGHAAALDGSFGTSVAGAEEGATIGAALGTPFDIPTLGLASVVGGA